MNISISKYKAYIRVKKNLNSMNKIMRSELTIIV